MKLEKNIYLNKHKIIPKINIKNEKEYIYLAFNSLHDIEINKKELMEYYKKTSPEYIISPFTILNEQIYKNMNENTLNIYIKENSIYYIILDESKRYVKSDIIKLTSKTDIKKTKFYDEDKDINILLQEIIILEFTEFLKSIIDKNEIKKVYLNVEKENFNKVELKSISEFLKVEIEIIKVEIDSILLKYKKKRKYIYIKDKKENKKSIYIFVFTFVFSILLSVFLFIKDNKENTKEKTIKQELLKKEEIKLPNHVYNNTHKIYFIKDFLNIFDNNTILKELKIKKNKAIIVAEFFNIQSHEVFIDKNILKIYKKSNILLLNKTKDKLITIIEANNRKYQDKKDLIEAKNYNLEYFDNMTVYNYLKKKFNKNVKLFFKEENMVNKYKIQKYKIEIKVSTPLEFYQFIDKINRINLSLELGDEFEFIKINDKIEVTFNLKFNQLKK